MKKTVGDLRVSVREPAWPLAVAPGPYGLTAVPVACAHDRAPPFLGGPILIRKSSLMAVVASDDVVYLASV